MLIDFNEHKEELFNPLIYKLQNTDRRFVINYGGAGSSKSYSQTQHEILNCLDKKEKLLVIRKYSTTLKDSVISLFNAIVESWQLKEYTSEKIADKELHFENGSLILFRGLDDPEKIKSIAGITRVWIEEANELKYEDFKQLNLRLRGRDDLQMTLTFNPINEEHWIKKHFFDNPEVTEKSHIIKTTYLDNKFIDEAYKQELESYKSIDKVYYNVYALGEWGSNLEGRIFTNWTEIDSFPDIDCWYGLDFGFSNDPTAIVKVAKVNERIYIEEVLYKKGMTNSEIANYLKSSDYNYEPIYCDSAEPKSIQELFNYGINAKPADKGKGSIMQGIDYLKQNKVLYTNKSVNLKRELTFYVWDQDKNGTYVNKPKDFMNHLIDAVRYAFSKTKKNNNEYWSL